MTLALIQVINAVLTLLWIAILIRAVLSWVPLNPNNPITAIVVQITEPVLMPIRRLLPRSGGFDLSPMIAIILIVAFATAFILHDRKVVRDLDRAAEEIGTVRTPDNRFVDVRTANELTQATGFSTNPGEQRLRLMAASSSHEARIVTIENRESEAARQRDSAVEKYKTSEKDRNIAEQAALDAKEYVRQQRNESNLVLRELTAQVKARDAQLNTAAMEIATARILYKEQVNAGRCQGPLDEIYPRDAGISRAHYRCDFGLVVCDGRRPSEANNCRRVESIR